MNDDLKLRQEAGKWVETKMLEFLLQYTPAEQLSVGDIKHIAAHARTLAFSASELTGRP